MITDRTRELVKWQYQKNSNVLQAFVELKKEYPELRFQDIATEYFRLRKINTYKRGNNYGK